MYTILLSSQDNLSAHYSLTIMQLYTTSFVADAIEPLTLRYVPSERKQTGST